MPQYSKQVDNWSRYRKGEEPILRSKVSFTLRSDLLETLDAVAEQRDTSRSSLVEEAVREWLVGK